MSFVKEVVEIFEVKPPDAFDAPIIPAGSGPSLGAQSLGTKQASPGVKTRIRVHKKGILHSPCQPKKYKRRTYSARFVDEEEVDRGNFDDKKKVNEISRTDPAVPGPSSSSISVTSNTSSTENKVPTGVMKFRAKVTTLDEILKAQAESGSVKLSGSDSFSDENLPKCVQNEPLIDHPPRSILKKAHGIPTIIVSTPNSSMRMKEERKVFTTTPEKKKESHARINPDRLTFSAGSISGDEVMIGEVCGGVTTDESSTSSDESGHNCCNWLKPRNNCCHKDRSGNHRELSGISTRRIPFRDGWGRLFAQLPHWIQSLLGFFSKVYWRFVESLLGVGKPYRDENGQGNIPSPVFTFTLFLSEKVNPNGKSLIEIRWKQD